MLGSARTLVGCQIRQKRNLWKRFEGMLGPLGELKGVEKVRTFVATRACTRTPVRANKHPRMHPPTHPDTHTHVRANKHARTHACTQCKLRA